jgi:hypothetical protein
VTNYLATIAARTINAAPPVRPRLRGRFDPPAWPPAGPMEGSPDQPVAKRTLQQPGQAEIEIAASEEERDAAIGRAPKAVDRLKRHSSSSRDRYESEVVGLRTTVTEATDSTSLSVSTFRAASDATQPVQSTREPAHVPTRSHESRTVAATSPQASPPVEITTANIPQLRNQREADSSKSKTIDPVQKARVLQPRGIIDPATTRFDVEASSRHPVSNPQRVIEREIQTVVVRDGPAQVDSRSSNRLDSMPHVAGEIPDRKIAPSESGPAPVAIQPRVEPPVSFSPDRPSVHQSGHRVEPTVHVTIGRIEVRAVQQSSQPASKPRPTQPVMNLDDYLRRRSQGSAR